MKRNICIISLCNIYVLPYAKNYIKKIQELGLRCTILYWDRDGLDGRNDNILDCEKFIFNSKISGKMAVFSKLRGYYLCVKYFKNILSHSNYDKLVFLQSHTAVFCGQKILKKYKYRYSIEIRDYFREKNKLYYSKERSAIELSQYAFISSPDYVKFLPEYKYIIAHNYTPFSDEIIDSVKSKKIKSKNIINISFIGTIRFYNIDKKVLNIFKNDERFHINYFGCGSELLKAYANENEIKNTSFIGSFSTDQLPGLYSNTDIINNLYGNKSPFLDFALSNKLYHAAQFQIPILVCKDTFMETIAVKYGIGFAFNFEDPDCLDELFRWYCNIDKERMRDGCNEFLKKVRIENDEYQKKIYDFLLE